jgi:hypothetical protein
MKYIFSVLHCEQSIGIHQFAFDKPVVDPKPFVCCVWFSESLFVCAFFPRVSLLQFINLLNSLFLAIFIEFPLYCVQNWWQATTFLNAELGYTGYSFWAADLYSGGYDFDWWQGIQVLLVITFFLRCSATQVPVPLGWTSLLIPNTSHWKCGLHSPLFPLLTGGLNSIAILVIPFAKSSRFEWSVITFYREWWH